MYRETHCKVCGRRIIDHGLGRLNARFTCSDACRQRAHRQKAELKKVSRLIFSKLQTLRLTLKQRPDLADEVNAVLEHLEAEIRDLKRLRPTADTLALADLKYDRNR